MAAKLFISYSREDEAYRKKLLAHLSLLRKEGLIEPWHDRRIRAGEDFTRAIDGELAKADIILLLVSADFIESAYCYSHELERAMERHRAGSAQVVPVIVRPCDWQTAPFGMLNALPRGGQAITRWPNDDEAYLDIAQAIRRLVGTAPATPQRPISTRRRLRLRRHLAAGALVVLGLAGLAYRQPWRVGAMPGAAPAALTDRTTRPPAPAERRKPPAGAEAARDAGASPASALSVAAATAPGGGLVVAEGAIVIAEVAATAATGEAWDPQTEQLAQLPDLVLCFRPEPAGEEVCERARARTNASHAAETFADLQSWNETFRFELKNADPYQQYRSMGAGLCRFGQPCAVVSAQDGRTAIAEVLVLPGFHADETLRARYLRRCVDPHGILAQQWAALLAAAGIAAPDASRISYEAFARTFLGAVGNELTEDLLSAALEAGRGGGHLAGVANTFRGTLLQAALAAEGWTRTERKRIDRSVDVLRQGFAKAELMRFLGAGCD